MRFEKAEQLLQLAFDMQSSAEGLSLRDIADRFAVSIRTAQRMRDAVMRVFPQTDEVTSDQRIKRWRIPPATTQRLVSFSAEELADLDAAALALRRDNRDIQARSLESVAAKLRTVLRPEVSRRLAPDHEALVEAEGIAMEPGPKPRVDKDVLNALRRAIKASAEVSMLYNGHRDPEAKRRRVRPYGFLYGHRHYLVAASADEPGRPKTFCLSGIAEIVITNATFVRPPDFSLADFAERSFGVWQEEPCDVVWRFTPRAAVQAREFVFHPSQTLQDQPDGGLIVRFRAGGLLEMAWHLYCWGDQVEVLSPPELAVRCAFHRPAWEALP
ncbi:MAG: WYL domain-containing protein [Alphaproteobacteria bacterium]|nr:WYL domain-containing protein [Alphaproteobacteria bacterium]